MRLTRIITILVALTAGVCLSGFAGAENSGEVSNARFATVTHGPQNAIVIEEGSSLSSFLAQTAGRSRGAESRFKRQVEFLRSAGLMAPDQEVEISQIVLYSDQLVRQIPVYIGRAGGGHLTFSVDSATWSDSDRTLLQKFISIAYPAIVKVYSEPAHTATIKIVRDDALIDRDWFTGGVYEPTKNQIRLPRYNSPKSLQRSLLHLMVHAFHGPAMFYNDSWEEGFARAASVIVGEDIDPKLAAAGLQRMDFITEGGDAFYYLMPIYDLLNQPALGNNTFLTTWTEDIADATARFGGMLIPRLGMSSTAWLKVHIEASRNRGEQFFARFNELYYVQWQMDNRLSGNIPKLKEIASNIVPTVEGLPFDDWYKRQYVLDTSVTIGKKLYAYVVPVVADSTSSDHSTIYVFLMHYITDRHGDEQPISGYCYPVYWNHLYDTDIWLGAQYEEIEVNDGEGYLAPTFTVGNAGGSQRIAMDFTMNDLTNRVFFPMALAGSTTSESSLYGVVAGGASGTVICQVDSDPEKSITVKRGGFSTKDQSAATGWSVISLDYTGDGRTARRYVNKGPGRYAVVIDDLDSVRTVSASFPKGWVMMSVPGTPLDVDHAVALNVNPGTLLLARWQPDILGAYKYQMYPVVQPFQPGLGYWMRPKNAFGANVTVKVEDQSAPWRIGLMPGWNQIGCPFLAPVQVSLLQVETGNFDPISFNDARASGIVGPIFAYDTDSGAYIFPTTLHPWKGYWVRCYDPAGAVITVPGPEAQ